VIRLYLAAGVAGLIACLAIWGLWQRGGKIEALADAAYLRGELRTATLALEQAREAARVHRAYLDRLEGENARWTALEADLNAMEGRDAPLSPYLRAASERLYPAR
jgi:hypothetical protein